MSNNKKGPYAILPAEIRYDDNLSSAEKLLYAEISVMTHEKGYCYASNRYFANLYNVTSHTVSNWMRGLETNNYIKRELIRNNDNNFTQRVIYITTPNTDFSQPPVSDSQDPDYKNFIQNSTRENKNKENITSKIKENEVNEMDEIIEEFTSDNELQNTIRDYINMRKTLKRPLTTKGLQLILKKLSKLADDIPTQILVLEQSIENSWQGVFPLREETNYNNKRQKKTNNIFLEMLLEEEGEDIYE